MRGASNELTVDAPPIEPFASPLFTPSGRYRWVICALLFFATTINYIDRQILALLKPILDQQLHWSNQQFGWANAAFQSTYAVGLLGFGRFVDRFGTKIGYATSIFFWSIAAMSHAAAGSVHGFIAARASLGLGEGGNFPAAIKTVAIWFPKRERAFATSVFNAGSSVGPIIGPAIIPWIAIQYGWQAAFLLTGAAGLAWLFIWTLVYTTPEKSAMLSPAEFAHIRSDPDQARDQQLLPIPWREILSHRQAWSFIIAKLLTDPVWWFFLIWLPDYFKQTRHLDLKNSWIYLVSIYGMVTILSILGGWAPGRLINRGWTVTQARKICLLLYATCVVPVLFATRASDWGAVLLIGLAASAHQSWSANIYSTVSDMFPKRAVASLIGIGGMAGSAAAIFFPVYTGRLLDRFTAAGNVTAGYTILFTTCAFAYLLAFTLQHLLAPRFDPIE